MLFFVILAMNSKGSLSPKVVAHLGEEESWQCPLVTP